MQKLLDTDNVVLKLFINSLFVYFTYQINIKQVLPPILSKNYNNDFKIKLKIIFYSCMKSHKCYLNSLHYSKVSFFALALNRLFIKLSYLYNIIQNDFSNQMHFK